MQDIKFETMLLRQSIVPWNGSIQGIYMWKLFNLRGKGEDGETNLSAYDCLSIQNLQLMKQELALWTW